MKSNVSDKAGGRRAKGKSVTKAGEQGDRPAVQADKGAPDEAAGEGQPDPHKMSAAPLRGEAGGSGPPAGGQRGSPNVHMEEDASGDESPRFDR